MTNPDPPGQRDVVRLAISLGDPRGIGPEVVRGALKALRPGAIAPGRQGPEPGAWRAVVIGPAECHRVFSKLGEFDVIGDGAPDLAPGRAAGLAIGRAVDLALGGRVDAVVTAPVHKPALLDVGYLPGHTEMLMALTGAPRVGMVMCDEGWVPGQRRPAPPKRVLLATIHVPLARVPELVTSELLITQTQLLCEALRSDWGIDEPRIALCALNPHASDEGLFGTEEQDRYMPALAALARERATVSGPAPADTVFRRAFAGEFDAVIAPYHDVGMAAFKTASFGAGVNVTIGLPFIRTSPDHGTAFDIAGRGVADAGSMIQAILLAIQLASRRATTRLS